MQSYLDGTDTESEPFEDPIDTETPELPLTIAPPTSLPESTPTALVPILYRTARMAVRAPPAMSSGLSASMAEVAAMSESAFPKRFRSSYESSPSVSPPDLPLRKHYLGTSELVEDNEEEDDEKDGEIEESMDSDSVSEDAEDEEDSERPERVSTSRQPTLTTWIDPEDGMVYIDVPAYPPTAPPVQTPPLPEWRSGSLPISPSPSVVPSPISSSATNRYLRIQLVEERRARLELDEAVNSMRRGQEPRGEA
ncbi:hypothetical protein Tco_0782015 [Tanacetum coccineum]